MNRPPLMALLLGLSTAPTTLVAQVDTVEAYTPSPLFMTDSVLTVTLTFDWQRVTRDIDSIERVEHPATLTLMAAPPVDLDIEVRTRGHFRRQPQNCEFPPLRLDVKTKQVAGTVFQRQDKLKLVTHCQNGNQEYEQYLVLEYLVYRTLNVLTHRSFRARLIDITYIDTEGSQDAHRTVGIVLESEDELMARLGGRLIEFGVNSEEAEPDYMALVDVFQYLAGNTDWSVARLHNVVILDADFAYYPIPFDFDWTGMVSARYARPRSQLRIRTVRDRLYRGACHTPEQFAAVFQLFHEKQEEIYALYQTPYLSERSREQAVRYLNDFYRTIASERGARVAMADRCREGS